MLFRDCAGGIVFHGDQVLLMQNEKDEWVLPKGLVHEEDDLAQVAAHRVLLEAGVTAQVLSNAGETNYEFYSITRMRPVSNRVKWFIMTAEQDAARPQPPFSQANFFDHDDALTRISYTQDRSLLASAWEKYREIQKNCKNY